jgi:hypothetical protein
MLRTIFRMFPLALVLCSCGIPAEEQKTTDKAMETIDEAPERIRREVLRTCNKWMHSQRTCKDEEVRLAQMECWLEMGLPHLKRALKRNMHQRARDQKTLQHQSLCMEKKGWRFRKPTKTYM